ncbi:4032_t:CDS:2 [Ambispora leptoticha]|uniref:4032_t:CDS:1 n=1 Tax=Ambispora leptoticha TaxID=144679 RepID=A0A9N9AZL0_9GLOM|nr:4032_t:CDS:2 [Ambispora leptoticha]
MVVEVEMTVLCQLLNVVSFKEDGRRFVLHLEEADPKSSLNAPLIEFPARKDEYQQRLLKLHTSEYK